MMSMRTVLHLAQRGWETMFQEGPAAFFDKTHTYLWTKTALGSFALIDRPVRLPSQSGSVETITERISAIIPIKNECRRLRFVLQAIRSQQGISDIEIIVIDSGSTDGSIAIARRYADRVHCISPEMFHHADTRNLGVTLATGQYLFFTTGDAFLTDPLTLYDMVGVLRSEPAVACVSCRQEPHEDADLMARFHIWNHYHAFLAMRYDRTTHLRLRAIHPALQMRAASISNNCAVYRKETCMRYPFQADIGEDAVLGRMLLRDGHRVALLYSHAVRHSHTAEALYFFRLSLRSAYTLGGYFGKWRRYWPSGDISAFLYAIRELFCDSHIINAVFSPAMKEEFARLARYIHQGNEREDRMFRAIILQAYRGSQNNFALFLEETGMHIFSDQEKVAAYEKMYATTCGTLLGEYLLFCENTHTMYYDTDIVHAIKEAFF